MDFTSLSDDLLLETIKQIPDWDRYPWPEAFYEKFGVPKPKARDPPIENVVLYQPAPHIPLGEGKTEVRGPVEGGVRIIEEYMTLPVEVNLLTDSEEKKEETIPTLSEEESKSKVAEILSRIGSSGLKLQSVGGKLRDSPEDSSTLPTANTTTETLRV